jgi:type IV pilus assembly protein PilM
MNNTYFYKDKPLFGLDIGYSSIKVMQVEPEGKYQCVVGYGVGGFDSNAIKDGVIVDHESIARSATELFKKNIIGQINTRRVALSIPAIRVFTRTITLPLIKDDELAEAVRLEAEQYIPMPIDELNMDHTVIKRSEKEIDVLAVAIPKKIMESYMQLTQILGLEPVAFDTSILAAARLFERQGEQHDIPAVLIDFGSESADISVHDKTVIVTGTIPHGGDIFTDLIAKKLGVTRDEAHVIKTRYGLGKSKKQAEITEVLQPAIDQITKEIRRMIRYHEERSSSDQKIGQIITMGGGANMPGLSEYFTSALRLPVRMCDPWQSFKLRHHLEPPSAHEKSIYVTAAGLSLIKPREVF